MIMSNCIQIESAVVTGATGAIGTALCRHLIDKGIKVYAVCRPGTARVKNLPNKVNIVYCDLSDMIRLPELIGNADAFFHLGWKNTIGIGRNDMPSQLDNIKYTLDAVSAASKMSCKVFVGAGSQAEYGRVTGKLTDKTPCFPENGYGMAKLCAGSMSRLLCKSNGIKHIWVRILSVYGPYDGPDTMIISTIKKLLNGESADFTAGEQFWDYLYSSDAARALYLAAAKGCDGAVYPLGSGKAKKLSEYITTVSEACGSGKINLGALPYVDNQVMYLCADISRLTEDTGFVPEIDFNDGIKSTVEWYKENRS